MARQQISRFQFISLMTYVVMASGILTLPHVIAQFTLQDGWMVSGVFFLGTLVAATVVAGFSRTFPGQTFIQGLKTAFGPWVGSVAGLWMLAWFYIFTTIVCRELNVFVDTNISPNTPLYITDALVVVPVTLAMVSGLESISRLAEFINPLAILSFLMIVALSLQNANFAQLSPILAQGWSPVLRGGLLAAGGYALEFIVALQLVPHLKDVQRMAKDLVYTGAVLTVLGILTEVIAIGVLGPATRYLNFPILEVIRIIRVGENIERLDTVFVMGLVAAFIVKMSVLTFAGLSAVQDLVGLKSTRHLSLCAPATIWAGSVFFYRDVAVLAHYLVDVAPALFIFTLVGLPVLAMATHLLRQALRRGGSSQASKQPAQT